jgi:RNA polymerase sigma-70 factor (ECF subfamily)
MSDEPKPPAPDPDPDTPRRAWRRFVDTFEPLRPELYRYCRYLTRSAMDAEDLVQDTLARAFVTRATMFGEVQRPRAWLFRVASNLWIDRVRRAREILGESPEPAAAADGDATPPLREVREAAGTLIARLSPQERAAVVLKDVFDMRIDEIAETLSTTPGAIKAALHAGRGKLAAPADAPPARTPHPQVLDAFCRAFNARDLGALTALLLDTASVELVGVFTEYGPSSELLRHTLFEPLSKGVHASHLAGYQPTPPRAEVRLYRGEPVIVYWYAHTTGDAVRSIVRVATDGDRIAGLREYCFTPDVLAEIGGELAIPTHTNGYA